MFLTVGEISRALGISSETIRYYVKEGIITPQKNEENNYWEYSSEDLMKLTDVLFYRSMNLTTKDIKEIMTDLELEKIGNVISRRRSELIYQLQEAVSSLYNLQEWEDKYKEELELIGKFKIGQMPTEFRRDGCFEESKHIAKYLEDSFIFDKEDWGSVSLSFYCNINDEIFKPQRYWSVEGCQKINPSNTNQSAIEEKAEHCIFTEVHYDDNIRNMIEPIIKFAKKNGYQLEGSFYGREDTNYFIKGKRSGLYKVYGLIK